MSGSGVGTLLAPVSGITTRTVLRQAICRELQMPFFRRFNAALTVDASPAPTTLGFSCSKLTQEDKYWSGQWVFNVTKDEVRKIQDFKATDNSIKFEYAATAPTAGDSFEIHSVFNAFEIHTAINRAIADAYPSFFDVVTDETLITKEHTISYSLSGLSYAPRLMTKVFLENPPHPVHGSVSSAAAGYIIDSTADFSSVTAAYKVAIFDGTGAGQIRNVASVTGTTQINVTSNWTTTPDSTSKYSVWDPTNQQNDWQRVQIARFNAKENPTILYLPNVNSGYITVGAGIRLEYIAVPSALTTESSTTSVPSEFILHKALHYLFSQKINDNRADRQRYTDLQAYHLSQAETYRQTHAYNMPEVTIWTPSIGETGGFNIDGNPIGW